MCSYDIDNNNILIYSLLGKQQRKNRYELIPKSKLYKN